MDTLLYVSIMLVMAHLIPPAGIIQVQEPGFETREECHAWLADEDNQTELLQKILISFGPWAKIEGVACMTEKDARELNQRWGHKRDYKESPAPKDYLKQFGEGA
jgi:hypothetical protein